MLGIGEGAGSKMIRTDGREQGFALAATILALVLVGALVTGGFFAASQEQRMGLSKQFSSEAFYYAERGLQDGLGTYTRGFLESQMPTWPATWAPAAPTIITSGGQPVGEYELTITRLDTLLYFFDAKGTVTEGGLYAGATHRLGVVARGLDVNIPMDRALQVFGSMTIGGSAEVDGRDWFPSNWTGCSTIGDVTGLVMKDTTALDRRGNAHEILGDPPMDEDASLDTANFLNFGDIDFDELKTFAEKIFPPGTSTITTLGPSLDNQGRCDTNDLYNWGAPTLPSHACFRYFPIIYAEGSLKIAASGSGQGILLVEGDLELTGGMNFYGITIIKGKLKTTGNGGHLNGVTLVFSGGELAADETIVLGHAQVNFSSCSIERALANNQFTSRLRPIARRSWMDITAAGG